MSINVMLPTRTDRPAYGDKVRALVPIQHTTIQVGAVGVVKTIGTRKEYSSGHWEAGVQFPGVLGFVNISDADAGVEWL